VSRTATLDRSHYLPSFNPGKTVPCVIYLTSSVQQKPSWEAGSRSAGQGILLLFWNTKAHCRVHSIPPLIPILGRLNPVHTVSHHIYLRFILILSLYTPSSPKWCLPLGFSDKSVCISYRYHACYMSSSCIGCIRSLMSLELFCAWWWRQVLTPPVDRNVFPWWLSCQASSLIRSCSGRLSV